MSYKIGFIGMVREQLEADLWGTLEHMAAIGYQGIEGGSIVAESPTETEANAARLRDLGLEVVALSCSHYQEDQLPTVIENAQRIGARYIADYWAGPETDDELKALAEQLERMAAACAEAGLTFIYHNHEHEFVPRFGDKGKRTMFDVLVEETEQLRFELDIAWCHFGGVDPVNLIRRVGHRVPVLHVKDLWDDHVRGHFCAVGVGKVPCFAAIEAAAAKGTGWMVVEQDRPGRLSALEGATASILNLREAGLRLP